MYSVFNFLETRRKGEKERKRGKEGEKELVVNTGVRDERDRKKQERE